VANTHIAYFICPFIYLFSVRKIKLEAGHWTVLWNSLPRDWEWIRQPFSEVVHFRKRAHPEVLLREGVSP